jgi:RHS repeat-associated protein
MSAGLRASSTERYVVMIRSSRAKALVCALLATTACAVLAAAPAAAQSTAPDRRALDGNGVDLVRGDNYATFTEGTIGSGPAALALVRVRGGTWGGSIGGGPSQWDNISFHRSVSGGTSGTVVIGFGATSATFTGTPFVLTPTRADGSSLVYDSGEYFYVAADGTRIEFGDPSGPYSGGASNYCVDTDPVQASCDLLPLSIVSPDGKTVYFGWDLSTMVSGSNFPQDQYHYARLASVSNGFGYGVSFAYASNATSTNAPPANAWFTRTGAGLYNGTTAAGTVGYADVSSAVTDVTDPAGRTWRIGGTASVSNIRRPGQSSDSYAVTYNSNGTVASVTKDGVTTNYSRSVSGSTGTMTVTDALSHATTIVSDLTLGRPTSVTDADSHTTSYQYDSDGRVTRVTAPEGNYTSYSYDARGNVTQTQAVPKSGSGLATVTTSASYDTTCTNPATCNSPNSTTDARGNFTDYAYDADTGQLLSVTLPAPTTGATRPQTRYAYTGPVPTSVSQCRTGAAPSCVGTSDEVRATIAYDGSGNVTSQTVAAGDASLSATTAMTYDTAGNLLTVDGPLSGSADTTRYRYNAARELIGVTGPDPDGSGAMKMRATRTTYDSADRPTKVERGTVDSQSDSDWASFSSLQEVDTGYDAYNRPVTQSLVSGSATYSLTQASYDAAGRVQCVAQRMNPAAFGSLPTDACTLGTTSSTYGADRIVKRTFDAAGQTTLVQTGYGVTGVQADEVATGWTDNGKVASVTDAEGNKTSYVYDGLDRLYQTQYPSSTKGAGTSNNSDYEQLGYDANSNVTSRRLRDGNSIGYTYDALNRVTFKDLPGSDPDVTYSYDLLGSMTGASQTGTSLGFGYDALGRRVTETNPFGTYTSTFDVAGRRTRLTHPDGFYVDYDYLVTGEMAHIRENGASSGVGVLATYAYDDLGRRASVTYGDGSTTSYSYDGASRLTQQVLDLAGTAYDLTLGFTYNPAGQIVTNTRSNDTYAWNGHYNVNRGYTANGRNQYSAVASLTPTYDAKGNLTSDGNVTTGYDSENRMTLGPTGGHLFYDPLGRLMGAGSTSPAAYYDSDGDFNVAERNASGALNYRHVFGPGDNEPVVWYTGSGTGTRYFYHQDERGSAVALTDSSGNLVSTTVYDEYGATRSSNYHIPRFAYTGQRYMSGFGLYYYKARVYSPTWGRFLQTDPIGYGAGMNHYNYVGSDPVNWKDPLGLQETPSCPDPDEGCGPPIIVTFIQRWRGGGGGTSPDVDLGIQMNLLARGQEDGGSVSSDKKADDKPCKALKANAEKSKGVLPPYVVNDKHWNSVSTLTYYRDLYQSSYNELSVATGPVGLTVGLAVGAVCIFYAPCAASRVASISVLGGTTGGGYSAAASRDGAAAAVAALNARIQQLEAGC